MFQNESNKLNHIMQNNLIDKQLVDTTMAQCGVSNLDDASIRDTVKIANLLEKATGEKFIRMEMGVPGLAPSRIGTEAEIEALKHGVAQFYPMLEGYPVLSEEASRFVKNFMDVDIRPEGIIPTVGAMQASYVAFMALTECHKGKDTQQDDLFPAMQECLFHMHPPFIHSFTVCTSSGISNRIMTSVIKAFRSCRKSSNFRGSPSKKTLVSGFLANIGKTSRLIKVEAV